MFWVRGLVPFYPRSDRLLCGVAGCWSGGHRCSGGSVDVELTQICETHSFNIYIAYYIFDIMMLTHYTLNIMSAYYI